MAERAPGFRRLLIAGLAGLAAMVIGAAFIWRDDIMRNALDPKEPFQTYDPPPAPDYARRAAWALMPAEPDGPKPGEPPADVFFVSPTTYDGGQHWNAPIDDVGADQLFRRVMAPNYAGPFVRVGRIFAPRYRQASLYTLLTLREDAREARRFAYGDVAAAFRTYMARNNMGRPFVVVGVEQGGVLAARLISDEIAPNPELRVRLVAAYLIETVVARETPPLAPCQTRSQTGCLVAWASASESEPDRVKALIERSLVWGGQGQLENLEGREPLCVNPLLGSESQSAAAARLNLGAANATGLEWGARPAFMTRQVSARCENGVLRVSRPRSPSLNPSGSWADRRRVAGFNLFYADLEADAQARVRRFIQRPSGAIQAASRTVPAAP